jgi:hypothetical protein
MNATLFVLPQSSRSSALHYLDEPRWFPPVPAPVRPRAQSPRGGARDRGRSRSREASPFGGATAPVRFGALRGAQVEEVAVSGRVLRVDVVTRSEEHLSLHVALFGANGSATLYRGSSSLENVGHVRAIANIRATARTNEAPESEAVRPDEPREGRFALVATRRVASAAPRPPHAKKAETTRSSACSMMPVPCAACRRASFSAKRRRSCSIVSRDRAQASRRCGASHRT